MNLCPSIVCAALTAVACANASAQTLPGDPAGLDRPVPVLPGVAAPAPLQRAAQTPLPADSMPDAPPDTRMRRSLRRTLATGRPRHPPAGDTLYASPYLTSPYAQSQDDPR
ncbi:hypothetical protein [Burkholderia sp. F1]|uniref:hypothetical protein n=1 Tax=Burkholderia sp. F1 TaxID=3366817 RepID=UPI003D704C81